MASGSMIFLTCVYAILAFVLYHKVFVVAYLGGAANGILKEILICGLIGLILATLTLTFWVITSIILAVVGLVCMLNCETRGQKNLVAVLTIGLVCLTAISGISLEKEVEKNKLEEEAVMTSVREELGGTEEETLDEMITDVRMGIVQDEEGNITLGEVFDVYFSNGEWKANRNKGTVIFTGEMEIEGDMQPVKIVFKLNKKTSQYSCAKFEVAGHEMDKKQRDDFMKNTLNIYFE